MFFHSSPKGHHEKQRKHYLIKTSDALHFEATSLSSTSIKEIGGLRLIWTDRFGDHHFVSTNDKTLSLFWEASLIWYAYYWPRKAPNIYATHSPVPLYSLRYAGPIRNHKVMLTYT